MDSTRTRGRWTTRKTRGPRPIRVGLALGLLLLLVLGDEGGDRATPTAAQGNRVPYGLEMLGHVGGATTYVAARGDHYFVGLGPRVARLRIIGRSIELAGASEPLDGLVVGLEVNDDLVIALTLDSVNLLDASGVGGPKLVGRKPIPPLGRPLGASLDEGRAWLALGAAGMHIVDVSRPAAAERVGRLAGEGVTVGASARGDLAAVISQPAGGCVRLGEAFGPGVLRLVDARPGQGYATLARLEVDDCVSDVLLDERRVWLLQTDHRLSLVDVTLPRQPRIVGSVATHVDDSGQGHAVGIALHEGCVIAVSASGRLDRVCPTDEGLRSQTLVGDGGWSVAMAIGGDRLLISGAAETGLRGFTLGRVRGRDDVTMRALESWHPNPMGGSDLGLVADTAWLGVAYTAPEHRGLWRVDLSRPQRPASVLDEPLLPGERVSSVTTSPERVYAIKPGEGVTVVDARSGKRLGFFGGSAVSDKLLPYGDDVIFGLQDSLVIYDLAFPGSPRTVGRLALPSGPGGGTARIRSLARSHDQVFVAAGAAGLFVVDLSAPEQPALRHAFPIAAEDVAVTEDAVYVASRTHLHVLSAAADRPPRELGAIDLPTPGSAFRKVEAEQGMVAVLDDGRVHLFDVRLPAFPREIVASPRLGVFAIAWLDGVLVGTSPVLGLVTLRPSGGSARTLWLPWLGGGQEATQAAQGAISPRSHGR